MTIKAINLKIKYWRQLVDGYEKIEDYAYETEILSQEINKTQEWMTQEMKIDCSA